MATVKLGVLVSKIAGSIAGGTFQRDAQGTQLRCKPLPRLRRTVYTQPIRQNLNSLVYIWRGLTNAERAAWNAGALLQVWTNRFGDVIAGKGYWMFLRCNLSRRAVGLGTVNTYIAPAATSAITGLAGTMNGAGTLSISWTTPAPLGAGDYWAVSVSPRQSGGRASSFGYGRVLKAFAPGTASPQALSGEYAVRFPGGVVAGQKVFVTVQPVDKNSGWPGPPSALTITVA